MLHTQTCYSRQQKAQTDWTDMKGIRISPYQSVLKCIHTVLFRSVGKNRWKPRSFVQTLSLSWRTVISGDDGSLQGKRHSCHLPPARCLSRCTGIINGPKDWFSGSLFPQRLCFSWKLTLKPPSLSISNTFSVFHSDQCLDGKRAVRTCLTHIHWELAGKYQTVFGEERNSNC